MEDILMAKVKKINDLKTPSKQDMEKVMVAALVVGTFLTSYSAAYGALEVSRDMKEANDWFTNPIGKSSDALKKLFGGK
jgi:hypothetical protein